MGTSSSTAAADSAARSEAARQGRLQAGMNSINSVFDGGGYSVSNPAKSWDPKGTYYDASGNPFQTPMANVQTQQGRGTYSAQGPDMNAINGLLNSGQLYTSRTPNGQGTFSPQFYAGQRKNYLGYYEPQVQQQYTDTRNALNFALARTGLSGSSAGAQQYGQLQQQLGQQQQALQGKASDYVNQTKTQVQTSKNDLVNQLYATSDPSAAANASVSEANILAHQPSLSPLGSIFSNSTNLLANSARVQAYNPSAPGLFGSFFGGQNATGQPGQQPQQGAPSSRMVG